MDPTTFILSLVAVGAVLGAAGLIVGLSVGAWARRDDLREANAETQKWRDAYERTEAELDLARSILIPPEPRDESATPAPAKPPEPARPPARPQRWRS